MKIYRKIQDKDSYRSNKMQYYEYVTANIDTIIDTTSIASYEGDYWVEPNMSFNVKRTWNVTEKPNDTYTLEHTTTKQSDGTVIKTGIIKARLISTSQNAPENKVFDNKKTLITFSDETTVYGTFDVTNAQIPNCQSPVAKVIVLPQGSALQLEHALIYKCAGQSTYSRLDNDKTGVSDMSATQITFTNAPFTTQVSNSQIVRVSLIAIKYFDVVINELTIQDYLFDK